MEKNTEKQLEHLDKWNKEFLKLSNKFWILTAFGISNQEQNKLLEEFKQDPENHTPNFRAKQFTNEELQEFKNEFIALKRQIEDEEKNPAIKLAYIWTINTTINQINFIKASAEGDMESLRKYGETIYGKTNPEYFKYTLENVQKQLADTNKANAQNLRKLLKDIAPSKSNITHPEKALYEKFKGLITQKYSKYTEDIDEDKTYTQSDIKQIFDDKIKTAGYEGWKTEFHNKGMIKVDPTKNIVFVPNNDKTYTGKRVKKLVLHEIFIHVQRSYKGSKSQLGLLSTGLFNYDRTEEGVTLLFEQALDEKFKSFAGDINHLLIGLAQGLAGKKYTFKELFDITKAFYEFQGNKTPEKTAFNRLFRIFRGTDCKDTNICFPKDKVYREGNIKIWELLGKYPNAFRTFTLGKYDPTNPTHIWILNSLGLIEESLTFELLEIIEEDYKLEHEDLLKDMKKQIMDATFIN